MGDKNRCKIYSTRKIVFLVWSVLVLSIVTISCNSDKVGAFEHPGVLQLGLSADTADIPGDQEITKAVLSELEAFLNTDQYQIEILQGEEETVVSSFDHYKDMPDLVELERGNYRIRASMGEQKPAAFEAPRFEGVSDFIIKENMTTKLNITCALANARVAVAYTDSFKVVYPTYSLAVTTSHTTEPFEFVQDETRPGWFQVNADGEDLKGILTVKPDTGEIKQYAVTIPSVKPKDNVKLTFNSTPNTRPDQGLTVKITINDETEEKPVYIYIPDYMLPVDAALLEAHGFAHEDPIVLGKEDKVPEANVKMYVPGTIENCKLSIWEEDGKPEEYDLAHLNDADKGVLTGKGYNLPEIWHKKQVMLDFAPVIERLPRIEDGKTEVKVYNYQLIVTDSLVNAHVSNPLTLSVKMIPNVAPKILLSDGFISSDIIRVTEGGIVYSDGVKNDPEFEATIKSTMELSACLLKITDATGVIKEYDLAKGEAIAGVKYDLSASTPFVNFKEAISALTLDDDNVKRYEYELTVRTEFEGTTYEDVKTFIVDLVPPKFEMSMNGDTEVNGDAFAKRAVLRATTKTGSADKLSFQLFENGGWKDITKDKMDGEVLIKEDVASVVVTGLKPETQYRVRAKYGNHVSGEMTFTTEKENTNIPNKGFEEWQMDDPVGGSYWRRWYPWKKDDNTRGWNTINLKTTQYGNGKTSVLNRNGCTYSANSGTIPNDGGQLGKCALLKTIGWGDNNKADGSAPKRVDVGCLYLGKYNSSTQEPEYGIPFSSRPLGFSFYYKYYPKNEDYFVAKIAILSADGSIIAEAQLMKEEAVASDSFTLRKVFLNYTENSSALKADKISILFQSGSKANANRDCLNYPGFGNLSDGEFLGSQLYVDEVELLYE